MTAPGFGYCIHYLFGHLREEADIQFKTTCIHCYENFGCTLMDPDDVTTLQNYNKMRRGDMIPIKDKRT